MKIIKTILKVLGVVIVLWAVISIFLPSERLVIRSTTINAPIGIVFDAVNDLHQWQQWSYWDQIDPKMESRYEGPEKGVGAIHYWSSEHKMVGKGSLRITESVPDSLVRGQLSFENWDPSDVVYQFENSPEGVHVSVSMDVKLGFAGRFFPGVFMDGMLGKDFEKTLAGLKEYTEKIPVPAPKTWNVETVTTTGNDAISIRGICNRESIETKMQEMYNALQQVVDKQKLQLSGPAYTIYHVWAPPDTIDMETGFPLAKAGKTDGDVKATKTPESKALRIDYYGPYSGLDEAHEFINNWMKENNAVMAGAPWEEYVVEPMNESDSTKWLTKIYYPVQ